MELAVVLVLVVLVLVLELLIADGLNAGTGTHMTEALQGSQASARSNVAPGNMGIGHGMASLASLLGALLGGAMPVPPSLAVRAWCKPC